MNLRERIKIAGQSKVGKPYEAPKPRLPEVNGYRPGRAICPRSRTVTLWNGMEVPMVPEEVEQWGKETSPRYLTAREEMWQRTLPIESGVDPPF